MPTTHLTRGRFASAKLIAWDWRDAERSRALLTVQSAKPIRAGDAVEVRILARTLLYRVRRADPLGSNESDKQDCGPPIYALEAERIQSRAAA